MMMKEIKIASEHIWVSRLGGRVRILEQRTGKSCLVQRNELHQLMQASQENRTRLDQFDPPLAAKLVRIGAVAADVELEVDKPFSDTTAYLELTTGCNLRCTHCYMAATKPRPDEMTESEWSATVGLLTDRGISSFVLTGGEPLIRRNLVYSMIAKYSDGCSFSLITNGTTIRKSSFASFLASAFDSITVSLDGTTEYFHDRVRGKGAWKRTIGAVELLIQNGASLSVNMAMTPELTIQATGLVRLAETYSGIQKYSLLRLTPMGRCSNAVSTDVLQKFRNELRSLCRGKPGLMRKFGMAQDGEKARDSRLPIWGCGSGIKEIYVKANGRVFPCRLMTAEHLCMGNISSDPLEVISSSIERFGQRQLDVLNRDGCSSCPIARRCGGGCIAYFRHDSRYDLKSVNRWRSLETCKFMSLKELEDIWGESVTWDGFDDEYPFVRLTEFGVTQKC